MGAKSHIIIIALSAAIISCLSSNGNATVIDFESYTVGEDLFGINLGGLTLTKPDEPTHKIEVYSYVAPYNNVICVGDGEMIEGIFDKTVSFFSIQVGRHRDWPISGWIAALDAFDNLLEIIHFTIPVYSYDLFEFSISTPNIAKFQIDAGDDFWADNIIFPTPEPSVFFPFGIGFLGLIFLHHLSLSRYSQRE